MTTRPRRDLVVVTYGEPPTPAFTGQLVYSWRILVGLTRTVAPIPKLLLPVVALSRGRGRWRLWTEERYTSPLESITEAQARRIGEVLAEHDPATDWRVHVAYEFRPPVLAAVLRGLPPATQAVVVPMYAGESSFTHALSRRVVEEWLASGAETPSVEVQPALDPEALADISAAHVLECLRDRPDARGPHAALVLAAHGTLLNPSMPIDTGLAATERLCDAIGRRLAPHFGLVVNGWLNHSRGGQWTVPPIDEALRAVVRAGFTRAAYYPYGFLADNAESELEGAMALRAHGDLQSVHLPCLNDSRALADLIVRHVKAARAAA